MNGKIRTASGKAWRIVAGLCLAAGAALGGVVAVNDAVPYPQLVVPEGTAEDPTIFLYDGYHRNFDLVGQGLDIGTYNPYIALHIVNQSVIRSTKIWFLGGDYPNKVGESQDPTDYPGHQAMILDNSDMTTGEFRVGSKNSDNTLTVRNGATMSVGKGLFIDMYDGVGNNAVVVTGVGTSLSITNGAFYVGFGNSSNENLSVLAGASVTVGTTAITQRLRIRNANRSWIRVAGSGSSVWVTGNFSLGESNVYCFDNRLIVEDGGLVKIDGTLTSVANASLGANGIRLRNGGRLALKGTPSSSTMTLISNLLAAGESSEYTFAPGTGDLAGYTVWTAASDPEPDKTSLLIISGQY